MGIVRRTLANRHRRSYHSPFGKNSFGTSIPSFIGILNFNTGGAFLRGWRVGGTVFPCGMPSGGKHARSLCVSSPGAFESGLGGPRWCTPAHLHHVRTMGNGWRHFTVTERPPVPVMVRRLDIAIYVRRCEPTPPGFWPTLPPEF